MTLCPESWFQGYKNAIDDQLEDATCVLDAFHIVKLGGAAVDDVRRRIQQETLGHRGRKGEPLYGIRHVLRAGRERLTTRQQTRLEKAFAADSKHVAVEPELDLFEVILAVLKV